MSDVVRLDAALSESERLRIEWAESLRECMALQGVSRKELKHRLSERGVDVTLQAIGTWLRGEASPRAYIQGKIGDCLGLPAHRIFRVAS